MTEQIVSFAERFFSWGFYSADLTFLICTVVLLGHFDAKKPMTFVHRVLDLVVLLVIEAALALAKYLITGGTSSLPVLAVMLAGYAFLQKRIRTTDKIARCTTFFSSFILLIGITGTLAVALGLSQDNPLRWLMPNIGSFAILLVITLFLKRFSVSAFRYIPRSYAFLVVAICLIAAVTGWFLMTHNMPDESTLGELTTAERDMATQGPARVNLFVNIGSLVLVLISYRMFYLLSVEHEQRAERLVTKRTESDNAEMIGVTKSVYEQMREVRHETKNHVAYMQSLLDAGDYDKLREFFCSFKEQTAALLAYVQSGNATVDAVVNAKIALANSQGIEVKTMLAVPDELGFPEEELYVLIANLMDNAIEGTVASGADSKVIKLSIRPEGGYYFIMVQNPCKARKDASGPLSKLKTTKADKDVHGYGTRVISRIAQAHRGDARYQIENNMFTVNVMLAQEVA